MEIPTIDFSVESFSHVNENIDEKKELDAYKLLCNACLCMGRNLHEITDEKMSKFYLEALRELPLCSAPAVCPSLCQECKVALKTAAAFKEQVIASYRTLQSYSSENLHEYLLTKVWSGSPAVASELQNVENVEKDADSMLLKDELKIEWGTKDSTEDTPADDGHPSDSDAKDLEAVPAFVKRKKKKNKVQSKIKRAEKIVKRLVKKSKKSKSLSDQRITTLELSYEEMLLEREKEATKEAYLKAPYKCDSCIVGFNYRRSYKAHVSAKHNPSLGNYICPICKTIISSVESFTSHYKRHMRRYECILCQKRTVDVKVMQQHYYSTHEISLKQYKCDLCGKISNSIDTHRYHKDSHKARVPCTECDKTFTHRAGLLNHRLSVHELHNAFPCTACDKVFRWKTSLKRHLDKHDLKDKARGAAAYCMECGVTFSSVSSYQRHMKNSLKHVTQDQLRFICDECGRRFADKTKLRDHIEEKHLHRTYQCHICLKPSKNRVALDQHVRNVHKGRPNNKICHHCGKGFPTKVQLESHIRTHTGERPFICEFCPTTFSQQSNLYKHNRQVHLNIKSKRYPLCKRRKEDKPLDGPDHRAGINRPYEPSVQLALC